MNTADSRALVEEKQKEEVLKSLENFPVALTQLVTSYIVGDQTGSYLTSFYRTPSLVQFFANPAVRASEVLHNLAYRREVNETLVFMQNNPQVLQTYPLPIEVIDRGGHPIRRTSIMGALVALDEIDVIEVKPGDSPCSLISTVFSWFDKASDAKSCHIKTQLQEQLKEAHGPNHGLATKKRRDRHLGEIEILINAVSRCAAISNDSYEEPFENLLNIEFIQDFIKNAFNPDPHDNGEWGVVFDCWQLYLDFIDLLGTYVNNDNVEDKSRPNLGGLWKRKTDVVATAVYLAILRRSQFAHLEVFASGIGNVSGTHPPVRFDCSNDLPVILKGIGVSHCFGFYGDKFDAGDAGMRRAGRWFPVDFKTFVKQRHQHYTAYATKDTDAGQLFDNVEIRRSPTATAASS